MCDDVDRCIGYLLCSRGRRQRWVVQQEKFLLRTCTPVLRPESDMLCPESVRPEAHMLCPESVLRPEGPHVWLQSVLPQEKMLPVLQDARMVQEEGLRMQPMLRTEASLLRSQTGLLRSEAGLLRSETGLRRSQADLLRSETGLLRSEADLRRSVVATR